MSRITEYVGSDGIVSSTYDHGRCSRPRPGDIVRWNNGTIGRVWEVESGLVDKGQVHVCESLGSAFLGLADKHPTKPWLPRAYVSISGGPFLVLSLTDLQPTLTCELTPFWNWGDNMAGADMGVTYWLARPVFAVDRDIKGSTPFRGGDK